MEAGSSLTCS